MVDKTRSLKAREVERLLIRVSTRLSKGKPSKVAKPLTGRQVIVPAHGGKILPIGTLRNILKNAEIPESEWRG